MGVGVVGAGGCAGADGAGRAGRRGERLTLGREEFTRVGLEVGPVVTYDELWQAGGAEGALAIDFLTPTAFQQTLLLERAEGAPRKQRKVTPLPDPTLAATSWWFRWNAMMDWQGQARLPERVRDYLALLGRVALQRADREHPAGPGSPFIGFLGWVVAPLLAPADIPADIRAAVYALAAFANFCGTGVETMRGMGQTRVSVEKGEL